jgi:hypothetical protein
MPKFIYYPYFLITVLLVSCQQRREAVQIPSKRDCEGADAVERLPWLKQKASALKNESLQYECMGKNECFFIARGKFNNQIVFQIGGCCPNGNSLTLYYRCDGSSFGNPNDSIYPNEFNISGRKILWSTTPMQ